MSSQDQALPAVAPSNPLDEAGVWFWQFLKNELAPYPGRAWVVGRMVIAATIVMMLVMTFRIPYGFLGAIYTMLLSRENPTVTFRSGVRTVISYAIATIYTVRRRHDPDRRSAHAFSVDHGFALPGVLSDSHRSRLHHRGRLRLHACRRDSAVG